MERYIHDTYTHNLETSGDVVEILYKALKPASVVDIGCGTGTFLRHFKNLGVSKVLGIDGPWANKTLLRENLDDREFREMNLEQPINLNEKFDLAVCVEVAEHIDEKYSDDLITSLTRLSDIIAFSAAIPGQDGQNHVNEQWIDYWVAKFDKHGYIACDVIRPIIWDNKRVQWWYKQNMFLAYRKGLPFNISAFHAFGTGKEIKSYVHPDNYTAKTKWLEDILHSRQSLPFYVKQVYKKVKGGGKQK